MELSRLEGDLEILIGCSDEPIITLRGELDFRNKDRVRDAIRSLLEQKKPVINVDVKDLVFMDSTGVSTLIDAAKTASLNGCQIRLISPSAQLIKVTDESGVSGTMRCDEITTQPREAVCRVVHDTRDTVDLEVPARAEMLAHIRARVGEFACLMPFTGDEIEDIKLATGEAGSNAIRHGCQAASCNIDIHLERRADSMVVRIIDHGPGFDPAALHSPQPGSLVEGGRGIMFMRLLMDEVTFSFGNPGTCVEMVKKFRENERWANQ